MADEEPILDIGGRVHPAILGAIRDRLMNTEAWRHALPGTAAGPFVQNLIEAGPRLTQQAYESGYAGTPMTPEQMVPGTTDFAMSVTGMGTPFALGGALGSAGGRIRAYHGSPHDFERFDINKIGTGEGAQSYGHGLYFAENPATAQAYRSQLAPTWDWTLNGERASPEMRSVLNHVHWAMGGGNPRIYGAREITSADLAKAKTRYLQNLGVDPKATEYLKDFEGLEGKKLGETRGGRTYEVDIRGKPEEFMSLDTPLSKQPTKIQTAADPYFPGGDWPAPPRGMSGWTATNLKELSPEAPTGLDLLRRLELQYGPEETSYMLGEHGFKGLRYEDQFTRAGHLPHPVIFSRYADKKIGEPGGFYVKSSRPGLRMMVPGAEGGPFKTYEAAEAWAKEQPHFRQTSNYVVFDDKLIDIIKKYGLVGLLSGSAIPGMVGNGER